MIVRVVLASVDMATAGDQPVTWPEQPDAVVVELTESFGELAEADRGPSLRVFGDGRVMAHYPPYMRRAGDWTTRLDRPAMEALVGSLASLGLLDIDPLTVRRAIGASRARGGAPGDTVVAVSDLSTTTISLRANGRTRSIAWHGLRSNAKAHPDVTELQRLRTGHQRLLDLMADPRLTRTR
jgi:hypothetical protein